MGVGDCICGATSASGQAAACCGIAVLLSACRPTLLPTAAAAARPGSLHLKGFRFFADDEDTFQLEDILQVAAVAAAAAKR